MRVLVTGCDGYEGYPLTAHLLVEGHEVYGADCFYRRQWVAEMESQSMIPIPEWKERKEGLGDFEFSYIDIARDWQHLEFIFKTFQPEAIIDVAAQPSAPYSMKDIEHSNFTMRNNVESHMNLLWQMKEHAPESHLITVGTMGAYGFPNVPIPEGFFEVEYRNMNDILPFPRQGGSVYHVSKIQASHLCWMAARIWELRVTDVQQSIVYGTRHNQWQTRFDIDECFGTFLNRAVASAIIGYPITVYGSGLQQRAFISLADNIKTLALMTENHPTDEDSIHGYRVINQFSWCHSIIDVAKAVQEAGDEFDLNVELKYIENPRVEPEVHFYKPDNKKLHDLGWQPTRTLKDELKIMFEDLLPHRERLLKYKDKIAPKIRWRKNGRKGEKIVKVRA